MKHIPVLAIGLLAGIAIGAGGIETLKAQTAKKPGYVIAQVDVTDQATFDQYRAKVPETLKPFNTHYLVRAEADTKEGTPPAGRVVVIAFDSKEDAEKWHDTPPYSEIAPIRQRSAKTQVWIVEGLPPQ